MLGSSVAEPSWLDPLIAEAKRKMRRRRILIGAALVFLAGIAAAVVTATHPGGPGGRGPNGNQALGTPGQAVERAFARRAVALTPAAAMPELCDRSACMGLLLWGGAKPVYLVPRQGRDFAVVIFGTAAAAHRVGAFQRSHAPNLGTYVRGSALLVYLRSSPRIARLKAALAAAS